LKEYFVRLGARTVPTKPPNTIPEFFTNANKVTLPTLVLFDPKFLFNLLDGGEIQSQTGSDGCMYGGCLGKEGAQDFNPAELRIEQPRIDCDKLKEVYGELKKVRNGDRRGITAARANVTAMGFTTDSDGPYQFSIPPWERGNFRASASSFPTARKSSLSSHVSSSFVG
jgi:hypothetical protein